MASRRTISKLRYTFSDQSIINRTKLLLDTMILLPRPFSPGFDIHAVIDLAMALPSHSWEFGTAAEALLELYDPALSVFGAAPFPIPHPPPSQENVRALAYAMSKTTFGTGANGLADGDGAVGDPASLGVSAVLLGKTDPAFAAAADEEVRYITTGAPRFENGAISQRADVAELWADFMYMAPPFLAYYAADAKNASLLQLVVEQCGLYRQVLQAQTTASYAGVWEHIIGPQSQDTGLWSTGNGWAAAGMARVLATVMKALWHRARRGPGILDGAMGAPMQGGLLRNYLNDTDTQGHGFGEISGSSMLAAVAYRMAVLQPRRFGAGYVQWADAIRRVLGGKGDVGELHVTPNGTVTPAGQNFVVLMYAAWRDCVIAGVCRKK
ncbi:hypothetical protein BD779DRAFT_1613794 [Infundibulicybe gibba]|nr:hypothetical protein BD779DRAFT_1613794 [Infundibulicybe gibba]